MDDLKNIITRQDLVINNQNLKIISELKTMNDRLIQRISNVNKQLLQLNSNFGSNSSHISVIRPQNVIIFYKIQNSRSEVF